ncbi:MAG TPA: TIGR02147 family protein [Chitinivibrionales bacterium]|jgi:uncharacterized protein (TIGR02147 family)|nr:TIGR02147 family protein [Chitinivibrionales bacterium]
MKPLTDYTDFRSYLTDWVEERKSQGLPGSNRWFAMKMGINSTSWLTSVLKGVKGLSKATANRLSQLLRHSPIETRYFETMVFFNQARTIEERNRYYQELNALQKLKNVRTVKPNQYDLYSTWYHSAVRSLIGMHPFGDGAKDFERLALLVSPPITASQARKSVELLEQLDLIKLNGQGFFELTSSAITTGENIRSLSVANFQQETMRLAQEALDRYPREERYIGTVTVGASAGAFEQIRKVLLDANEKIAEIANADADADRVFQVNLQAFPLSKADRSRVAVGAQPDNTDTKEAV